MGNAHKDYLEAQATRAALRKEHSLGCRKKGSAKAQNKRDRPDEAASGICLICGSNRLKCICSGHMSEDAYKRFTEEQRKRPTPEQSGFDSIKEVNQ